MSLNICMLSGRITRDPEMAYTNNGLAVTKFSLAVEGWDSRSRSKTTDFINHVCFDKVAEKTSQYIKKGDFIETVGRLSIDKWMDNNGNERSGVSIICSQVEFTPAKGVYAKQPPQTESSNVQMPPYYQDQTKEQSEQTNQEVAISDPGSKGYTPY